MGEEKTKDANTLFLPTRETRDAGERTRPKYVKVTKELKIVAQLYQQEGKAHRNGMNALLSQQEVSRQWLRLAHQF